jgi:hypothetical protein
MTAVPVPLSGAARPPLLTRDTAARLALSLALVLGYYATRGSLVPALTESLDLGTARAIKPATVGVWLVAGLLGALVFTWRRVLAAEKKFHAPLLITSVLLVGDAAFGILLNHPAPTLALWTGGYVTSYTPTLLAIATTVVSEMLIGRFYFGKWPHIASAYVSGISAGILIKSPELWPFVLCGLISITSKYVLRLGDRHLWNPTNLGVTLMLLLAGDHVASLSVEAGNEIWSPLVIWVLGGMILWQLGRWHISLAFIAAFVPLAVLRSLVTGHDWRTEVAPITSPMFQLYIFFMITDPKTTTQRRWSQVLVAVLVAVMETVYRLAFEDVHSLYHALFTVGPVANLVEIWLGREVARRVAPPHPPTPSPTGEGESEDGPPAVLRSG